MILIRDVLVDERILTVSFACPLPLCGGKCCIEGEEGPPVSQAEARLASRQLKALRPYMDRRGYHVAVTRGPAERLPDGSRAFRCLPDGRCIFAVVEPNGILKCAIEQAHRDGAFPYPKPVSCHLYPIRIEQAGPTTILHFEEWDICRPAFAAGKRQRTRVYQFVKTALIRHFGAGWYEELEAVAADYFQDSAE